MEKVNEGSRVVIACALGALVGSFLTLEFVARINGILWQTVAICSGIFVGGFVGYLTYRFDEVCVAAKQAVQNDRMLVYTWEKSVSVARGVGMTIYTLGALFCVLGTVFSLMTFYVLTALVVMLMAIVLIMSALLTVQLEPITLLSVIHIVEFMIVGPLVFGFGLGALCWCVCLIFHLCGADLDLNEGVDDMFKVINELRPVNAFSFLWEKVVFYFMLCGGLLLGAGRVGVNVFKYIHSDARIICFCGATIGSIAGFVAGSAFVGCAAGAAMGYLEYQVVSVRWLKLIPLRD